MRSLYIAWETFILLLRNKVVVPLLIVMAVICLVAFMAIGLAIDDYRKIMDDVGFFGFHLVGGLVAIFWGVQSMADSHQEGSLEVQLAAPISRPAWLLGKFLGMSASLIALAFIFLAFWQGLSFLIGFGWMTGEVLVTFAFLSVIWLLLAGTAVLFASFCNLPIAMLGCISAWVIGLVFPVLAQGFPENAPDFTRWLATSFARYWNLTYFNLSDKVYTADFPAVSDLFARGFYGTAMLVIILTFACLTFSRKDLIR